MSVESPMPGNATASFSNSSLGESRLQEQEIRHNCAIVGIYAPGNHRLVDNAIDALTHLNLRGQEGAGLWARGIGNQTFEYKEKGLAAVVFPRDKDGRGKVVERARRIEPFAAIGQDRYSTSGNLDAWQPFVDEAGTFALVHNGNITNAMQLRDELPADIAQKALSDTWIAHQFILHSEGDSILEKVQNALPNFEGAYSLIMESDGRLIAARDPWGMRPLVLGRLSQGGGWILASEDATLAPLEAEKVRDIDPGEVVVVDQDGVNTIFVDPRAAQVDRAMCSFEAMYIMAPDSFFEGRSVDEIRREMGRIMARKDAAEGYYPEIVAGIQESGIVYAQGYHEQIVFEMVMHPERFGIKSRQELAEKLPKNTTPLVRNAHAEANRAFMKPNNRRNATELKHRPNAAVMSGKRALFFDDSIVRLTTMGSLTRMARGAYKSFESVYPDIKPPASIDVRIGFPLIKFICNWGADFQNQADLGARRYVPEIEGEITDEERIEYLRRAIGAASLKFPTAQELVYAITGDPEALNQTPEQACKKHGLCGHCFLGVKPTPVRGLFVKEDAIESHVHSDKELVLTG